MNEFWLLGRNKRYEVCFDELASEVAGTGDLMRRAGKREADAINMISSHHQNPTQMGTAFQPATQADLSAPGH